MFARIVCIAGSTLLAGCSLLGIRSGYEQPRFTVLERLPGGVEIRAYGPRLAAETEVEAADQAAGRNAAFRILAAYIFGANRSGEEVAMTAPVEVQEPSTRVAMTAPVEVAAAGSRVTLRFFMPARFERGTLPEPTDPRVRIVEVPGESIGVLRFSGRGGAGSVAERRGELLRALAGSAWRAEGEPVGFFYDPPWTLPFLRRNEVGVRVAPATGVPPAPARD